MEEMAQLNQSKYVKVVLFITKDRYFITPSLAHSKRKCYFCSILL